MNHPDRLNTRAVRATDAAVCQVVEYWPRNSVVTESSNAVAVWNDDVREAVRDAIGAASAGENAFVDLDAVGRELVSHGFRDGWRAINYLESHDELDRGREPCVARLADPSNSRSWYAGSRSRVGLGLVSTGPGIPMIFVGQEITAQRVLSVGADTRWVGSVILTAEGLFTKAQLVERIDSDQALTLVFEIAQHCAHARMRDEYVKAQSDAASSFDRTIRKDRSVILPTVANVPARCKELLQNADHVQRDLLKLVNLF